MSGVISEAIKENGVKTILIEDATLPVATFEFFKNTFEGVEIISGGSNIIDGLRRFKDETEFEKITRAQEITDASFADVLKLIRPGMTEKQLQAELIYCQLKNGADGLAFDPIVISGPNTSVPHGVAGDRVIQAGDFITFDFGAAYRGYCSDMTRTVAVGFVTEEMETVYNTVLKAQEAALAATKPGLKGKEIDGVARKVIADAGYGAYFGHGYGHSLGLEIHEAPNCGPSSEVPMQAGNVCSAEPGIYIPGELGVRIEDVIFLKEDGCENLTNAPKELIIL